MVIRSFSSDLANIFNKPIFTSFGLTHLHPFTVATCTQVIADLLSRIQAGGDASLDALTSCTGCKTCGHEGGGKARKPKHPAAGCACCGTHAQALGGSGAGGCVARAFAPEDCQCAFHRSAAERLFNKVCGALMGA